MRDGQSLLGLLRKTRTACPAETRYSTMPTLLWMDRKEIRECEKEGRLSQQWYTKFAARKPCGRSKQCFFCHLQHINNTDGARTVLRREQGTGNAFFLSINANFSISVIIYCLLKHEYLYTVRLNYLIIARNIWIKSHLTPTKTEISATYWCMQLLPEKLLFR